MAAERKDLPPRGEPEKVRESAPDSLVDGLHTRIRRLLTEVEGVLRDPSLSRDAPGLSGPAALEAENALAEMKLGLEAAYNGVSRLRHTLTEEDPLPPLLAHLDRPLPDGLPETVRRFLRERSRNPGFEYHLENDRARGWTLRWKQRDSDGFLLGAGHLFERPFSPPGR
jgi:hypothetical protein